MKALAKYHACNHCVIGEKTFKKLPGLSRNGILDRICDFSRFSLKLNSNKNSPKRPCKEPAFNVPLRQSETKFLRQPLQNLYFSRCKGKNTALIN